MIDRILRDRENLRQRNRFCFGRFAWIDLRRECADDEERPDYHVNEN
jgi:hypothetical protein